MKTTQETKQETIKFYIPFGGFYYSIYSDIIDNIIASEIEENYMTVEQSENIDYSKLHEAVSEHIFDVIVEEFNDEFDLFTDNTYFTFDGLSSPKFYNYSTDKIKAICSLEIYLTLLNKFENNDDFVTWLNEASKSRSGFCSFYEGLSEVKQEPSVFLEYLFRWYYNEFREDLIYSITDNINEVIYNNLNY